MIQVQLLVICPDDVTADRYAGPIPTSLDGYTHWPIVLRPERVPGGQGREEGREEGLVAGERGTVLMVLKARGLPVSDSQRSRIDACDDLAVLKAWAQAALTAAAVDDLFN